MAKEILKIYTDKGMKDNPSFKGIELHEYSFNYPRMGMPSLSATLMWDSCLDNEWTRKEYVVLRGERYYIRHIPTSEKTESTIYRHELQFKSERDELFANVYFYDTVYSQSLTFYKPCSNSSVFTFYGTIREAVDRLNAALLYSGIGDSILKSSTTPSPDITPVGDGYYAVINPDGEGDLETSYEFSFEDKSLWEAIVEFYEKTGVMFRFAGRKIVWNDPPEVISQEFEYGAENELLSVKKANANAKVINRITMLGSDENIPYYYPNETEYGHIKLTFGENNQFLNEDVVEIENYSKFLRHVRADQVAEYNRLYNVSEWLVGETVYSDISFLGLKFKRELTDTEWWNMSGDTVGWVAESSMKYQSNLVPPIYRKTKGDERFYNALDDTYENENGESIKFPNPYIAGSPSEHIFRDEDIKPTIEGIKNEEGRLFGEILAVEFDEHDNDDLKVVGEDGDALQYQHSYFYLKLNIFNGKYGFNLFDRHSQTDAMTIQMTSGNCDGCKFKIQAVEKVDAGGFNYYENPVQTDGANGNIVGGDYEQKVNKDNIQSWQQNTETNSIWVCVQKDVETFGQILPSRTNSLIPEGRTKDKPGDTFNIINIDLPQEYIEAAEERLMNAGIEYMAENNEEKFTFSISFSRIYLEENPDILARLNEYSKVKVAYDGRVYELFVSSFKIDCKANEALPDIQIELTDTISVGESFVQQVANQAASLIPNPSKNLLNSADADRRFLSKVRADRTPYGLAVGGTLLAEDKVGTPDFIPGIAGGIGWNGDRTGHFEMKSLTLREFLEVPELRFNRTEVYTGIAWRAPGGGIVESYEMVTPRAGFLTLKLEDGEIGMVASGDICMGIWHHTADNATEDKDDGNGNFAFAGFTTVYFRIVNVQGDRNERIRIELREGYLFRPQPGMHFVCYGNRTNKNRQTSCYETRAYTRFLADVDDYTFGEENIMMQFGDLSNLRINGVEMGGYSAYLNNVYFQGVIKQITNASAMLTLDTMGDPFVGGGRKCIITPRVVKGVEDITGSFSWMIQSNHGWTAKYDKTDNPQFTIGNEALSGYEEAVLTVNALSTGKGGQLEVAASAQVVIRSYGSLKGEPGERGERGEPGEPGKQGDPGVEGAILRIVGEFKDGTYYDGTTEVDGVRWKDVVWCDNSTNSDRRYFVCKKTGEYKTNTTDLSMRGPSYSGGGARNWEEFSYINLLMSDIIIAKEGRVNFLSSNEIVFGEVATGVDRIWGRIGAPTSVGDIIMWLGGATAGSATTVFDKRGFARFGTQGGRRIEVDPKQEELRVYNEDNNNVVLIDGKIHDIDNAYGVSSRLEESKWSPAQTYYASNRFTLGGIEIGDSGGRLSASVNVSMIADTIWRGANSTGTMISAFSVSTVTIQLQIWKGEELYDSSTISLTGPGFQTTPPPVDQYGIAHESRSSSSVLSIDSELASAGTYWVSIKLDIEDGSITDWRGILQTSQGYNSCELKNYTAKFTANPKPKAFLGANGILVANSTQDYFKAGTENGKWVVEAVSIGKGLRISDGTMFARNNSGQWQEIDIPFKANGKIL